MQIWSFSWCFECNCNEYQNISHLGWHPTRLVSPEKSPIRIVRIGAKWSQDCRNSQAIKQTIMCPCNEMKPSPVNFSKVMKPRNCKGSVKPGCGYGSRWRSHRQYIIYLGLQGKLALIDNTQIDDAKKHWPIACLGERSRGDAGITPIHTSLLPGISLAIEGALW